MKNHEKKVLGRCVSEFESKTQVELKLIIENKTNSYWGAIFGLTIVSVFLFLGLAQLIEKDLDFYILYFESLFIALTLIFLMNNLRAVRYFLSTKKKNKFVQERAGYLFFKEKMYHTKMNSGILLYYSMLENHGIMICDIGVYKKIKAEELKMYEDEFLKSFNEKDYIQELGSFIRTFGVFCHQRWPDTTFENELSDEVSGN